MNTLWMAQEKQYYCIIIFQYRKYTSLIKPSFWGVIIMFRKVNLLIVKFCSEELQNNNVKSIYKTEAEWSRGRLNYFGIKPKSIWERRN